MSVSARRTPGASAFAVGLSVALLACALGACGRQALAAAVPAGQQGPVATVAPAPAKLPARNDGTGNEHAGNEAAYRAALQRTLPMLAVGSPRERLAALWLQATAPSPADILAASLPGAGSDALLAAAALKACAELSECPVQQVMAVTAALAAGDAGLQLLRLALVEPSQREALWEAASNAARFDDGLQAQRRIALAATDSTISSAASEALRTAHVNDLTGIGLPDYWLLATHCPRANQVTAQVLQCRKLFALLADSTSLPTAMFGTAKMRTQALDPAQAQQWAQRARQLEWLGAAAEQLPEQRLSELLQWSAQQGDLQAIAGLLRQRGLPVTPPAGWKKPLPVGW
jgi:hypothetical protein